MSAIIDSLYANILDLKSMHDTIDVYKIANCLMMYNVGIDNPRNRKIHLFDSSVMSHQITVVAFSKVTK